MKSIDPAAASDVALIELSRSGVSEAFAELWKRHSPAILAATRSFTSIDADDVVQEAFVRVLQQIRAGKGPQTAFRPYVIMAARNVASNMARSRSYSEISGLADEEFEELQGSSKSIESQVLGSAFTQQVFSALPSRWQEVLWYREVEDLPVNQICVYLGMSENATSVLLKRAREGFKQAWIAANLEPVAGLSPDCQWVVDKIPQMSRGRAPAATQRKLAKHFETCVRCAILSEEAAHVHSKLAMVLLPGILGGTGATGYLAWLQSGAAAPANAATFDSTLAMATTAPPADPTALVAAASSHKVLTGTVAVLSVGALAVSITFTALGNTPEAPVAVERTERETPLPDSHFGRGTQDTQDGASESDENRPVRDTSTSAPTGGDGPEELGSNQQSQLNEADTERPPAEIEFHYEALRAAPRDGAEAGVYPQLIGSGATDAIVTLRLSNELGQTLDETVSADSEGRWSYTPNGLMGHLAISAQQTYLDATGQKTDPKVSLGEFDVGRGLSIRVEEVGRASTRIRISGAPGATKNHVVTLESTKLGILAEERPLTKDGEFELTVEANTAEIGDISYWQGSTSQGPRRIWIAPR